MKIFFAMIIAGLGLAVMALATLDWRESHTFGAIGGLVAYCIELLALALAQSDGLSK